MKAILEKTNPLEYVVAITGDLTENGNANEFVLAQQLLAPLKQAGYRIFCVPGNHDVGFKGIHANHHSKALFRVKIQKHFDGFHGHYLINRTLFVCLDSTDFSGTWKGQLQIQLASGRIGDIQLKYLWKVCKDQQHNYDDVVILMHHHPFWTDVWHDLEDSGELLKTVHMIGYDGLDGSPATLNKKVSVLFGHRHVEAVRRNEYGVKLWASSGALFDVPSVPVYADHYEVERISF